jgi:hypothetical protein
MVALQSKMEYCTEILKTLLGEFRDQADEFGKILLLVSRIYETNNALKAANLRAAYWASGVRQFWRIIMTPPLGTFRGRL